MFDDVGNFIFQEGKIWKKAEKDLTFFFSKVCIFNSYST